MRARGFTLVELLVALAVMALMAGLGWRGLDGMAQSQQQVRQRSDATLALQAGLAQWSADLDALVQLPQTPALDWDGRALRITRRSLVAPGEGLLVVAWARRTIDGTGQWLRWQSPPVTSRRALQAAWAQAAQWAQNPGDAEKQFEVRITALQEWKLFYYRADAWSNPLSSDGAPSGSVVMGMQSDKAPAPAPAPDLTLPDGVRLVLTLPPGEPLSGTLTRDWVRPTVGGNKS